MHAIIFHDNGSVSFLFHDDFNETAWFEAVWAGLNSATDRL